MELNTNWQQCNSETFWQEVGCGAHVVQFYENEDALLNMLEDFAVGGISVNDCVIIIASKNNLSKIEQRLEMQGLNVNALTASDQFIPLDAEETLSKIMINGYPDNTLFVETITELFDPAHKSYRKVRIFGELVALLWAEGNEAATVMLENFWNIYFEKDKFSLFCAYPNNIFKENNSGALSHICNAHSKVINNTGTPRFDLTFMDINES